MPFYKLVRTTDMDLTADVDRKAVMDHKGDVVRKGGVVRKAIMDHKGGRIVNIAGVIGLTVLLNKKTNNKVFLFYDDHENINYCPSSQQFISDLLNTLLSSNAEAKGDGGSKYMLILEEPFIDNHHDVRVLWDDVKHLCLFRDFYSKIIKKCSKEDICNGFPVDMRIALIDFSLYLHDYSNVTIKLGESFSKIFFLFDLSAGTDTDVNDDAVVIEGTDVIGKDKGSGIETLGGSGCAGDDGTVIVFLKNVFSNYTHTFHYRQLKKKVEAFYNKFIKNNVNTRVCDIAGPIDGGGEGREDGDGGWEGREGDGGGNRDMVFVCGYPFTDDEILNFFDELDKILSAIMEFYMIILINIFKSKQKIVYAGYYHCKNVKHILTSYYDYEQIYNTGITDNVETSDNVCSCISIPATLFN
jgi:hypothetical protein